MAARRSTQDLCVITIDHYSLLMPATDGLKMMALLGRAKKAERDWGNLDDRYFIGERPNRELKVVSPKNVVEKG